MAIVSLNVQADEEDLKKFFNKTSAISQEFEGLTTSKNFKRLVYAEAEKNLGSGSSWPKHGLTKEDFLYEVKSEIRMIATVKGLEFFIKQGSLMAVKPVIAASVNETTLKQAVKNVCKSMEGVKVE